MLQVGEFSKICAVSVKTLHHYDRIGLLRPESVDPVTGYRYYSTEQIDRMLYIQRLKRYGFSLYRSFSPAPTAVRSIPDCCSKRKSSSRSRGTAARSCRSCGRIY